MSLLGWAEEPKVQEEAWTGGRETDLYWLKATFI